jgi:magnesium transporter
VSTAGLPSLSDPVARHVTKVDTTVRADMTIAEAIAALRARDIGHHITYFYVVDNDDKLVGVVSSRSLLLADSTAKIRDEMDSRILSVKANMTLEDALEYFAMYRLLAFPVVDDEGKLLGIIDVQLYADEVYDLAQSQRMVDLYQIVGLSVERARQPRAFSGFRSRMPWLLCNMAGGMACAVIAGFFSMTLEQVIVLALFIPLVLTLSESISMQSMTLSLPFLHRTGVSWRQVGGRLHVEWRIAALLGITSGLLVGAVSLFWGSGFITALAIAVSILCSMIASAVVGLSVPVVLHALKLDPKIAAGPVVLTLADVITTTTYLGLATALLT